MFVLLTIPTPLKWTQGPASGTAKANGWIELVLIEARDLIAADLRGTSDPYVRVTYGNLKKRTKVRKLHPKFLLHKSMSLGFSNFIISELYLRNVVILALLSGRLYTKLSTLVGTRP
jgi:hypothetical protein